MLEIQNVSFQYHAAEKPALQYISLTVEAGMFLAVVGPSGSGKSTLLRSLNGLVPHFHGGRIRGHVRLNGEDTRNLATADLSREIGFVSQEPETQTVFDSVIDEVAFGPENLGIDHKTLVRNVNEALELLHVEHLRDRDIFTLSGGERQRVVLAATLAMGSRVLVLDEPLSQLDPWASAELLRTLYTLNREHIVAVVIAEHRIDDLLRYCTHVLELNGGESAGGVQAVSNSVPALTNPPSIVRLANLLGWPETPVNIPEAQSLHIRFGPELRTVEPPRIPDAAPLVTLDKVTVHAADKVILDQVTLRFKSGTVTSMMGANGSGKTTLLRAIAGLQRLTSGSAILAGRPVEEIKTQERPGLIGFVPQHPASLFLGQSVREEIEIALGVSSNDESIDQVLHQFELGHLADRYSWDISGGERQRLALAIAVAPGPRLLILDEPTRGMDQHARQRLHSLLTQLKDAGTTIILSTHDSNLTARCADVVALLEAGRVTAVGNPSDVLSLDPVLMTDIGRVLGPDFLTLESVRNALPGASENIEDMQFQAGKRRVPRRH